MGGRSRGKETVKEGGGRENRGRHGGFWRGRGESEKGREEERETMK